MVYALAVACALVNALTSVLQRLGVQNAPADAALRLSLIKYALRRGVWLLGFALMIVSFASQLWLGIAGFLVMFASAVVFERNLRKMGKAGWQQVTETMRAGSLKEYFGDAGKRIRRRFKPEE